MFRDLPLRVTNATVERLTALLNHVIASEPAATARLRAHIGATVRVRIAGWPSLLPALPDTAFRITPAGLLESIPPDEAPLTADLEIEADGSNPLAALGGLLTGSRPRVDVAGSAALAADMNWLIDNLRWDLQDDLAQLIGPAPAHLLGRVTRSAAAALRAAARTVGGVAGRGASGDAGAPPAR